mmetsp:Transcript_40644/g.80108  ORF Transcript_40644/g.80108 Transcript_40644/m.80108 type:complete len:109 (+) Transcript_40644:820-1146(+)
MKGFVRESAGVLGRNKLDAQRLAATHEAAACLPERHQAPANVGLVLAFLPRLQSQAEREDSLLSWHRWESRQANSSQQMQALEREQTKLQARLCRQVSLCSPPALTVQ